MPTFINDEGVQSFHSIRSRSSGVIMPRTVFFVHTRCTQLVLQHHRVAPQLHIPHRFDDDTIALRKSAYSLFPRTFSMRCYMQSKNVSEFRMSRNDPSLPKRLVYDFMIRSQKSPKMPQVQSQQSQSQSILQSQSQL